MRAIVARPEHLRLQRVPHRGRRAAATVEHARRLDAAAARPVDVERARRAGTALTEYPVHSVFEDFTWDKSDTMSGAADDWAYEHLGVFGWTTEFWDVIHAATGERGSTDIWYVGPTPEQELAIARWSDQYGEYVVPWYPFDHPQLGPVEIGGPRLVPRLDATRRLQLLADEVRPHAEFAVHQALAAPCWRSSRRRRRRDRRRRVAGRGRHRQHRLAAHQRQRRAPNAATWCVRSRRARAARRRGGRRRAEPQQARSARRPQSRSGHDGGDAQRRHPGPRPRRRGPFARRPPTARSRDHRLDQPPRGAASSEPSACVDRSGDRGPRRLAGATEFDAHHDAWHPRVRRRRGVGGRSPRT